MKNKYLVLLFALCIFVVGCSSGTNDNELEGKYNELLTKISKLEKKNEYEKQVEELNAKIAALEESNKKLTEDLETINSNLENVIKEKDSLKSNYNNLKSNYNSLSEKVDSQKRDFYYITFVSKHEYKLIRYVQSTQNSSISKFLILPTDNDGYIIKSNVTSPYPFLNTCDRSATKYLKDDGTSIDPASQFTSDTIIYITCDY